MHQQVEPGSLVIVQLDCDTPQAAQEEIHKYIKNTLKSKSVLIERSYGNCDKVAVTVLAKAPLE